MVQLKHLDFIKPTVLTEMAYTVANTIWPDLEAYFDKIGFDAWVDKYALNDTFNDESLQNLLRTYFTKELKEHGFYLRSFGLAFDMGDLGNEGYYGKVEVVFMPVGYQSDCIPTVTIQINIHKIYEMSQVEFFRTLFHEISHVEQQCKVLYSYTAERLALEEPNVPINVAELAKTYYSKREALTDTSGFSSKDEIGAYANDFAMKLFYVYKQELKSRTPEQREAFLREVILKNYMSDMLPDMKTQFNNLSEERQRRFLRQLFKQLREFISGLL